MGEGEVILHVVDALDSGGAERVAVDLVNCLATNGKKVILCTTRRGGILESEINCRAKYVCISRKSTFDPLGFIRFRRLIIGEGVSIVHCHGNSTTKFCILATLLMSNLILVHHDHNPLIKYRNRFLEKYIFSRVDIWIAVSQPIFDWVRNSVQYRGLLRYIPNPIDVTRFARTTLHAPSDPIKIVIVANYKPHKDYANLIFAVKQLMQQSGHRFLVSGFGSNNNSEYYHSIVSLIEKSDLKDVVRLNGSTAEVPKVLSEANVGILTSSDEGLPISLLEYMASGLPVVVTDVGACGEIVRSAKCGLVVPPSDPDAFASALIRILQLDMESMAKSGRAYVEECHSVQLVLREIEGYYKAIEKTDY